MGLKWEPEYLAEEIKRIESEDPNLKGKKITGIADPAVFSDDRGQGTSIAALMEKKGVYFERGNHDRLAGKMQVHNRLKFDDEGVPMLYVFSTARNFIRTIPALCYSEDRIEDVDTTGEDHIYDELRYVLMENPISPRVDRGEKEKTFNPLETEEKKRYSYILKG